MKTFVTFGSVHKHRVNEKIFDGYCIASIECDSVDHGRELAFEHFGRKFSSTFHDEEIPDEIMKYFPRGIIELECES